MVHKNNCKCIICKKPMLNFSVFFEKLGIWIHGECYNKVYNHIR